MGWGFAETDARVERGSRKYSLKCGQGKGSTRKRSLERYKKL